MIYSNADSPPVRQSNFELLRIVSMLMVLTVHADGAALGLPKLNGHWDLLSARDIFRLVVESVAIVGVNCFTLVSGYFGIRLSWRKLVDFIFQCVFYSVILTSVGWIVYPDLYNLNYWLNSWLVLTHTDLWYVPAYFCLMILSPGLNMLLSYLGKKKGAYALILLSLINVYLGWWNEASFNPTGYTVAQLAWVYLLGRYIGQYGEILTRMPLVSGIAYIMSAAGIFTTAVYYPSTKAFAYNSPLVITASISFLLVFAGIDFRSKAVNYIAKSAFSVYLIHKNPIVWVHVMKPFFLHLWRSSTLLTFSLTFIPLIILIYLIAMAVDPIRRFIQKQLF